MDQFPLDQIVVKAGSRFAVVVAAAQRAKQIKEGSPPLVNINSRNPLTIALAEIAEGKVIILPAETPEEEDRPSTIDEYFAGRDAAAADVLPYRREPRHTSAEAADLDDDLEEEIEDEFEDEDEEPVEDE